MTAASRCPGCSKKLPRITSGELLELLDPGAKIRDANSCFIDPTTFHMQPAALAALRASRKGEGGSEPTGRRSPKAREPGEPLERDVKAGIKRELEPLEWSVLDFEQDYRPQTCQRCGEDLGKGFGTRVPLGIPDLYVLGHERHFWIEVKRPGGAVTDNQREMHKLIRSSGAGRVYILRSSRAAVELHIEIMETIRTSRPLPPGGEFPPPPPKE